MGNSEQSGVSLYKIRLDTQENAKRWFLGGFHRQLIFIGKQDRPASENQNSQPRLTVPKGRIRSRVHGLCSADLVAFDEGANAQEAGMTFTCFLYSNNSCLPSDKGLSGPRDFIRGSN